MNNRSIVFNGGIVLLSALCLIWLGLNTFLYKDIPEVLIGNGLKTRLIQASLLIFFFSHLIIIPITALGDQNNRSGIRYLLLGWGIISFIFLLLHFVSLNEISDDFRSGYSYKSMLRLAWHSQVVMAVFYVSTLAYFSAAAVKGGNANQVQSISRERIFVTLNIAGIASGLAGLFFILVYLKFYHTSWFPLNIRHQMRNFDILPFAFAFLPYLVVLAGWAVRYFYDRRRGWNDEKESSNINRSGMLTMMITLPVIIFLIIACFTTRIPSQGNVLITGSLSVLWLLFYLFFSMLVFSVAALYKFRLD